MEERPNNGHRSENGQSLQNGTKQNGAKKSFLSFLSSEFVQAIAFVLSTFAIGIVSVVTSLILINSVLNTPIKEQVDIIKEQMDDVKEQIRTVENKVDSLESKVEGLESKVEGIEIKIEEMVKENDQRFDDVIELLTKSVNK